MFLHFLLSGENFKISTFSKAFTKKGTRGKSIRFISFAFLPKRIGVFFFDMATKGNWVLIITTSGCQRGRGFYHAAFHKGREKGGFACAHMTKVAPVYSLFSYYTSLRVSQAWMGCGSEGLFFRYGEFF